MTNQQGADNIYDFLYQTIGLVVFAIFGLVMMYIGYLSDKSARPRGQETKPAVEPTTPGG
ncbi:hypothetical protein FB007_14119 [Sinorhizobium medicae]|nr:hypothetical protein FB007_14119 [Sinorhizobium medicae]